MALENACGESKLNYLQDRGDFVQMPWYFVAVTVLKFSNSISFASFWDLLLINTTGNKHESIVEGSYCIMSETTYVLQDFLKAIIEL